MEHCLLVYVPTGRDAVLTERLLGSAGIAVTVCHSAQELAAHLAEGAGALLLSEEALAACADSLRRFVDAQEAWSDLPVLLLTRSGMDSVETQRAVEHLGNVTLLERPVRTLALVSFVKSALRARERQYQVRMLDQRKDAFLATLAHELRNPLAPIVNATRIFERMHPSEQTSKLAGMVQRQISHLTRLIDDLMDVARINSGKIQLQIGPTTVQQVVTHAMEIASGVLAERQHRVAVHVPPDDVPLQADHVRLVQSLANLVVNAAKFTPPGGDISVRAVVNDSSAAFHVKDSGNGLSREALASVFGMFAQERSVGEPSTGLGIGLHLAKVFVEMHAGFITAHSDGPGRGSEFVIGVPRDARPGPAKDEAESEDAVAAAAAPLAAVAPAQANPRARVLVVDDNEDAANSFAELLAIEGVPVSVLYDGASAVRYTREHQPDAVVMDIGMPGLNGYAAAREIRAQFQGGGPRLIALTGWGQYADRERALAAGFDFHFVKPLSVQSLLACLAQNVEGGAGPA